MKKIANYTIDDIYFELPLYKKLKINWKKHETVEMEEDTPYGTVTAGYSVVCSEEMQSLMDFLYTGGTVYGKCPCCKKNTAMTTMPNGHSKHIPFGKAVWGYADGAWDEPDFVDLTEAKLLEVAQEICVPKYYDKYFSCPMCNSRYCASFALEVKGEEIHLQKIGQYPSLRDFNERYTNKFEKILKKKELYDDYGKSLATYEDGYAIAAFVYMRRIIERLVDEKLANNSNITNEARTAAEEGRFEDKLKLLRDELPEQLKDKRLYDIASAGIHELTEEECTSYFPVLQQSVELILLDEEMRAKKKRMEEELDKAVGEVHKEIGRRK